MNPDPEKRCSCDTLNINQVSDIKILGITFQKNGLFTKHVKNLLAHARSLIYLLKDMYHHQMSLAEVNRLFESVILSRIRYGISVYGCDANALRKIDSFLEKCHRRKYCLKRISIHEMLLEEDRRLLSKILDNEKHPLRPYLLSRKKETTYNTRHQHYGVKPKKYTKYFLRTFCNRILTA